MSDTLAIHRETQGFYKGVNKPVSLISLLMVVATVAWVMADPEKAGSFLNQLQSWSLSTFNYFYTYSVAFYIVVCLSIAVWPRYGKVKLGPEDGVPEFSTFSWFSMMFGAGIGIGVLSYAVAEPMWHFASNPQIILSQLQMAEALAQAGIVVVDGGSVSEHYDQALDSGVIAVGHQLVQASSQSALPSVFRYSNFHWGISAWSCYALVGVCLAFFTYNRGLPFTMRSTLFPFFGKRLEGGFGNLVDITSIIATMLGIAMTLGIGLGSLASGLYNVTGAQWLMTVGDNPSPTLAALILCLFVLMACCMASALSGVGRGIKWLSNLNMVLSVVLLSFFVIFGATVFVAEMLYSGITNYLLSLPFDALTVYASDSALGAWQGAWSIYYWAWYVAFAPFVGMFLARTSRNRTVREFVLAAVIAPAFMCILWFTTLGANAINLELNGVAQGAIANADLSYQLFQVLNFLLNPAIAKLMSALVVVLIITYLVTSGDSALLVINSIGAGGADTQTIGNRQLYVWGAALTAIIAALLIAGGLEAIKALTIVGSIPFAIIMLLMGLCLLLGLHRASSEQS